MNIQFHLQPDGNWPHLQCQFSPDGFWIVHEEHNGSNHDIYLMTSSGVDPIRITTLDRLSLILPGARNQAQLLNQIPRMESANNAGVFLYAKIKSAHVVLKKPFAAKSSIPAAARPV